MITIATATMIASSSAMAAEQTYDAKVKIEKDEKGNYEKTVSEVSKDAAGTKVTNEQETNVDVYSDGDKSTVVKTKSVKDPKGLFNKSTVETKDEIKLDDGEVKSNHEKTVDGEVVERTKTNY
jgi:hypothetical protein